MRIRIEIETDGGTFRGDAKLVRINGPRQRAPTLTKQTKGGKVSCTDAIKDLWRKGKFKSALSFAVIRNQLSDGPGYNFPDNTLMMALSGANYLTRRGTKGSYTWSQRHPYNG